MYNQENESNKEFDKEKKEQDSESEYIEKLPEELKNLNLPPEINKEIRTFLSMGRFSGSSISPILDKINQQHITKILESVEKDSEKSIYRRTRSKKV
ncbi:MAG: hypothetical protein V7K27_05735 [Nostoc sp.]|uniref:hypothetical protein n=1 Tax=Nostoc sp. TaxID=1180 RepID=UPI002FF64239